MPLVNELAQTYLTACEVEGKATSTIRGYRQSLTRLQEVGVRLGFPDQVGGFTVQHVYAFLGALREHGASRAYQHRLHREVKAFFSWCKRFDIVPENVFARVPLVKLEQQIVQPFSPEDVGRLLAAIDQHRRAGKRNYALVMFLLDTGVRASECVSVRLDDVDWERGRVRVLHGKGQKQRWVGLGERARSALTDYLTVRGMNDGPLFLSVRSGEGLHSLALNVLLSASIARMMRTTMLDVLQQDYMRTARAKGLSMFSVVVRHGMKNALIPVVTLIGLQVAGLIGGSVITESVFALPGLGRLLLDSLARRDYPIVQGVVVSVGSLVMLTNLVVDLSYGYLDPRVRYR